MEAFLQVLLGKLDLLYKICLLSFFFFLFLFFRVFLFEEILRNGGDQNECKS